MNKLMYDVYMNNFDRFCQLITSDIVKGESVNLVYAHKDIIDFLIFSLFDFHDLRVKFLKNYANMYKLIDLSNVDIKTLSIDDFLKQYFFNLTGVNFCNLLDIKNYLNSNNLKLIIYFSANNLDDIKFLFSFYFIFKDNCIFLLHTYQAFNFLQDNGLMHVINLNFNESFKNKEDIINNLINYYPNLLKFINLFKNYLHENNKLDYTVNSALDVNSHQKVQLDINTRSHIVNFDSYNFLTEREINFIKVLFDKSFLRRDDAKSILWGNSNINISDDALDQFISRLRRKLVKNNISKFKIQTIKGKGIKINF